MRNSALRGEEERGRAEDNICVGALQGWLKRNKVGMGTNIVSRCTELLGFIGMKSISSSFSPSFFIQLGSIDDCSVAATEGLTHLSCFRMDCRGGRISRPN